MFDPLGFPERINADKYGDNPPTTPADFFDTAKFPGPRALSANEPVYNMMLALAAAVRLTSPGPAIFRQRRYGLDGEEIVVRLIGLDTPETVAPDRPVECFGPEASARTKGLVEGGQVWLEYDEVSGPTDKYDRTLAFVWLDQQTMLNELLIREGFAEEVTYTDGYAHAEEFRAAEDAARSSGAGMWTACAGQMS